MYEDKRIERFRTLANNLQSQIDDKRRDMTQNPTPKRMKEYYSRLHDADNIQRVQHGLMVIADSLYNLIFSHDFAKAFWEDKEMIVVGTGKHSFPHKEDIPVWQCYLQQMVLEEEPLKYIEKFL